ncbi:MAG: hypothetical protein PHN51_11750 [Candidatus Nanopelagicales bacterium]|nr:hypothetical protein [Candidatus Nanopelagicales bacterium]
MSLENIFPYTISVGGFLFERDAAGALMINGVPADNLTGQELLSIFNWCNQPHQRKRGLETDDSLIPVYDVLGSLELLADKKTKLRQDNLSLGELFQIKARLACISGVLGDKFGTVYHAFEYITLASVVPDDVTEGSFKLLNEDGFRFATVTRALPVNQNKELVFQFDGLWVMGGVCEGAESRQFSRDYQRLIAEHPELTTGVDEDYILVKNTPMLNPDTKAKVKEIFLESGFTVKAGETDLKDYVYDAAAKLLAWGKYNGV